MEAAPPDAFAVRRLTAGDRDVVLEAGHLFDGPPTPEATDTFLASPGHHLLMAFAGSRPVGFVSGVTITHPDKGTEMLLYELGVDEAWRRRGAGRQLVAALAELAREHGCRGMWVLTEEDNAAALATYRSAGGAPATDRPVMVEWSLDSAERPDLSAGGD